MTNIVYSKDNCPYCDAAKQLLSAKGVKFTEINISHVDDKQAVLEKLADLTKAKTFPQIVLDGEIVGGFTDLRDYFLNKE